MQNEIDRLEHHTISGARSGFTVVKKLGGVWATCCISIMIGTIFSSSSVQAESLGGMKVLSALNAPLRAQLALNGNGQFQPECAKVGIQSLEGDSLGTADVRVVNGGEAMMLTTRDAISEPAVNVVVQMGCDVQEARTYPVLLDLARPSNVVAVTPSLVASNPVKVKSTTDAQPGSVKMRFAHSLSGLNFASDRIGLAVDSAMNGEGSAAHTQEAQNAAPAGVMVVGAQSAIDMDGSGVPYRMHKYWQFGLCLFAALTSILMLTFWRSARRVSSYSTRKTARRPTAKQVKTKLSVAALDPIPYAKPDMTLFPALNTASSHALINRERLPVEPAPQVVGTVQVDARIADDFGAKPPLYNVEEVVDEVLLAKLWMGLNQPLQAIEMFESYWGQKQPNTALPWQCMLELYRTTGDLNKYRELIGRYNSVFGENATKRAERIEHAEEGLRKRA